jgi:hypothetical protein
VHRSDISQQKHVTAKGNVKLLNSTDYRGTILALFFSHLGLFIAQDSYARIGQVDPLWGKIPGS